MKEDFRLLEFCKIVENLESVVSVCNKENTFAEETNDILREVSDIITDQIYEKLKIAIGSDFIYKIANIKTSTFNEQ